jgi:ferritin-like metal-binding protein YciE
MGLFTKDIQTMEDLFVHMLRDVYYCEQQLTKALPKLIDKATDPELRGGLQNHLKQTENHIARLERVFDMQGLQPSGVDCPAIDGIIKEANEVAGEVADKNVLDAAIIASGQAAEHYEITRYGTLIAWANELGRDDIADLLSETLEEEKEADRLLTAVAETRVDRVAA